MKTVFLYAGQGSQKVGMGKDLYEKFPTYKRILDEIENAVQVKSLMHEGPMETLTLTENTQPCMAAFAAGVTAVLYENGMKPDAACGLSLGEYGALHAAGVFDAKTGEIAEGLTDATLVAGAFNSVFHWGDIGQKFVAVAMFLFAFTTVLGWSHYGSKAWEYLFGAKTTVIFKIIHVITVIFGAVMTSTLAWDISDTFNGLMMIPNLIGVVVLFPLVMKITKNYINRNIKNINESPVLSYDPEIQAETEKNPEN